jgi:alginate O-acetyltransferase complex protein AlgI
MFPQLVAGPIVRYSSVARALEHRSCTSGDVARGVFRFTVGLAKKVLIANQLGELNKIAQASVEGSVLMAWLAAISFALQIYFDFSGYSDMALGLGRAMGFDFPENFNYPFISASVTEFWRRWHISLGTWFREYLYIPLGGNRVSRLKWLRNILIVWFCTGLWHGASWNYVVWGLYFGVLLVMEKTLYAGALRRAWAPVRYGYMFFVISIGFVIFENESLAQGIAQVGHMFGMGAASLAGAESLYYLRSFAVLLIAAAVGATPLVRGLTVRLKERLPRLAGGLEPVAAGLLLFLSTAYLVDSSFNPFLYFRF